MTGKEIQVVVTGMGAVTPFGKGVTPFWESLLKGKTALQETKQKEWRNWMPVSANVPDFDLENHLSKKQIKNTDRFTQHALIAAQEALYDAGITKETTAGASEGINPKRSGIAVGTAYGGVESLTDGAAALINHPGKRLSPRLLSKSLPNAAAAALAKEYSIRGPVMTYTTACAASANAIGEAMHWLKRGEVDVVLAGGAEYLFSPTVLAGLHAAGAVVTEGIGDKSTWSKPFDVNRKGMVPGEGAAFLMLETAEHAQKREAKTYATLSGYGASNDAYHETAPKPDGEAAAFAMRKALDMAKVDPEKIGYINAHATATPVGDKAESRAMEKVFQKAYEKTPVSSIKGAVGHMMGAAAAAESIACIKALETGWLPPTLHCDKLDLEAPPYLVREAMKMATDYTMSNSFGFGGQNGSLIWRKV